MSFLAKLNVARAVAAILIISIVATIASTVSHEYCHGANHNAHGAYCQAVYQDEYSAIR